MAEKEKKETNVTEAIVDKFIPYFNENAPEDQEDIMTICETASKQIRDKLKVRFDDPRLLGAVFSKIYDAILNKLESMETEYSDFTINIADRVSIGYTTSENDEDEKEGNFMVFIRHMNSNKKVDDVDDPTAKPHERAVQWNTENIIAQPDLLRNISVDAVEELKSINVQIGTSELIIPIFVFVYEAIISYLKIKRREKNEFEFEVNFMSCFYIGARESEDEFDDIYIRPNINSKLKLKNDVKASSKFE